MGSPISSTIAKIFLQHLEDIHIKQFLNTKKIIFYTRYVDNILIIYDTKRTNPNFINKYIIQIHTNKKLNPTHESNICFLDLLIRKPSNLEFDIVCKATTTDTTINFLSYHPKEHKIATYSHHITRINSLPLTLKRKQTEWTLIQLITQNSNFPQKLVQNLNLQIQHKKTNKDKTNGKNKKQKLDNLHILQPKNKENHKLIQVH